jgi:hypothetical protein
VIVEPNLQAQRIYAFARQRFYMKFNVPGDMPLGAFMRQVIHSMVIGHQDLLLATFERAQMVAGDMTMAALENNARNPDGFVYTRLSGD